MRLLADKFNNNCIQKINYLISNSEIMNLYCILLIINYLQVNYP